MSLSWTFWITKKKKNWIHLCSNEYYNSQKCVWMLHHLSKEFKNKLKQFHFSFHMAKACQMIWKKWVFNFEPLPVNGKEKKNGCKYSIEMYFYIEWIFVEMLDACCYSIDRLKQKFCYRLIHSHCEFHKHANSIIKKNHHLMQMDALFPFFWLSIWSLYLNEHIHQYSNRKRNRNKNNEIEPHWVIFY